MSERKLRALFDAWIERFGLSHWEIEIVVERIKPRTTTMRTTKSPNYDRARVSVQPWVLTAKPPATWHGAPSQTFAEQIETTVVHELLHLCIWSTSEAICLLQPFSKRSAFATTVAVQEGREELAIDNLSRALTRTWGAK
jgi:hypothetical protein